MDFKTAMSFIDLKDPLYVLCKSIHESRDIIALAAEMAQQLQDVHSMMNRGNSGCQLNEASVISLSGKILGIRTDLTNTAKLVPDIHSSLEVPWIGEKRQHLRLVHLSGDDPWEFYLSYNDNLLKEIEGTIKEKHSEGLLEKCSPKVGEFVACHQLVRNEHLYFRAVVTKYHPKLRKGVHVYKLDSGDRTTVFPEDVFYVPKCVVSIPSRVIKCCLLSDECDLKEMFCTELRLAFKDALEKSTLTVDILDTVDSGKSGPPHFSAVVWVFDENRCGADMNLNHWISGRVIPSLKEIPQGCSDVFTYIQKLDILDPFYVYETERETEDNAAAEDRDLVVENDISVQENCVTSTTPVTSDELKVEPLDEEIAASLEKVAEWINCGSYVVRLPTPEPIVEPTFVPAWNKQVKNEPKKDEQLFQPAQSTLSEQKLPATETNASSQTVETLDQLSPHETGLEKYKKAGNPRCQSRLNKENIVATGGNSMLSAAAPEFLPASASLPVFEPKCLVQVTKSGNDDDDYYDGVKTNLQEEYQPTDETRICLFYQKNGYCGRKLCAKEHVQKSSVWTTDTIETYVRTFNDIYLPEEGSEVILTVRHVKSPVSFYATLPESYSDIGEPGELETLKTLYDDLNCQESNNTHLLLPADPQLAELVIAMGYQEYLGTTRKKWHRARVLKVLDDTHVEVFFLDFGNKQVVKTKDLRKMRPQFLHLPPQAVLTMLYKLVPNPEKREVALKFLKDSIEQKELKAKIISRYDGELVAQLYMENGDCLNEILVRENLANLCG